MSSRLRRRTDHGARRVPRKNNTAARALPPSPKANVGVRSYPPPGRSSQLTQTKGKTIPPSKLLKRPLRACVRRIGTLSTRFGLMCLGVSQRLFACAPQFMQRAVASLPQFDEFAFPACVITGQAALRGCQPYHQRPVIAGQALALIASFHETTSVSLRSSPLYALELHGISHFQSRILWTYADEVGLFPQAPADFAQITAASPGRSVLGDTLSSNILYRLIKERGRRNVRKIMGAESSRHRGNGYFRGSA